MITAVAAVANDGNMMRPRIIRALQDREGNVVEEFEPEISRQIVSRETSATLRNVLERAVSEGTGSNAYASGYRVAGKTGTSEKLPRGNERYIASFVGFAPADSPILAVIVILDEPTTGVYYGGVIAAPVAGRILSESLAYLNIEPQFTAYELESREASVPDVRGMAVAQARNVIEAGGMSVRVVGSGSEVLSQRPISGMRVNANSIVTLHTGGAMPMVTVPDVRGMTVAQATTALTNAGLNIRITGAGATQHAVGNAIAFTQSIASGATVESGTIVTVEFRTLEVNE
jgi:stage V sporulation protein D (sporulation-specific penicillin-binding protein)